MDDLKQRLERYHYFPGDGLMEGHTGDWVRHDEAAAALDAKDAELARKDAAIREHIAFMESTGFSTRFLDGLRAAIAGKE